MPETPAPAPHSGPSLSRLLFLLEDLARHSDGQVFPTGPSDFQKHFLAKYKDNREMLSLTKDFFDCYYRAELASRFSKECPEGRMPLDFHRINIGILSKCKCISEFFAHNCEQSTIEFMRAVVANPDCSKELYDQVWEKRYDNIRKAIGFDEAIKRTENLVVRLEEVRQDEKVRNVSHLGRIAAVGMQRLEVILACSSEVARDIQQLELHMFSLPDHETLRAYYQEGYRYIYEIRHFDPQARPGDKKSPEQLQFLSEMARLEKYPPIEEQVAVCSLAGEFKEFGQALVFQIYRGFFESGSSEKLFLLFTALKKFKTNPALQSGLNVIVRQPQDKIESACTVLIDLLSQDKEVIDRLMPQFESETFSDVHLALNQHREEWQKKFPEGSLEESYRAFTKAVAYPAPISVLDNVFAEYRAVLEVAERRSLSTLDNFGLSQVMREIVPIKEVRSEHSGEVFSGFDAVNAVPFTPEQKALCLALTREMVKREYGIYPYNTQMLAVLLMDTDPNVSSGEANQQRFKGICEQIGTGEGKTITMAVYSLLRALQGETVHNLTSNDHLAARDYLKLNPLYQRFGIYANGHTYLPHSSTDFRNAPIVHSSVTSIAFTQLAQNLRHKESKIKFDRVNLDESDDNATDRIRDGYRIGGHASKYSNLGGRVAFGLDLASLQCFCATVDAWEQQGIERYVWEDPGWAVAAFKKQWSSVQLIQKTSDLDVLRLLRSASLSRGLEKDVDYVKENDQIIIVDYRKTGFLMRTHYWENGLQEMVCIREGVPIPKQNSCLAHASNTEILGLYAKTNWVTGTIGDKADRAELQEIFHVVPYDIPPHRPCRRIDIDHMLIGPDEQREAELIRTIRQHYPDPVLLICRSIKVAKWAYNLLQVANGDESALIFLTDQRNLLFGMPATPKQINEHMGRSGTVSVATNVAGRGWDVVLENEVAKRNGLLEISTNIAENPRVARQNRGRAGRQGDPGESRAIVSTKDPFIEELPLFVRKSFEEVMRTYGERSTQLQTMLSAIISCRNTLDSMHRKVYILKEGETESAVTQYLLDIEEENISGYEISNIYMWQTISRLTEENEEACVGAFDQYSRGVDSPRTYPTTELMAEIKQELLANLSGAPGDCLYDEIEKVSAAYLETIFRLEFTLGYFDQQAVRETMEQFTERAREQKNYLDEKLDKRDQGEVFDDILDTMIRFAHMQQAQTVHIPSTSGQQGYGAVFDRIRGGVTV